ncbi:hypothetical protein NUW54_g12221 [Trametes sanguinea]|uniref:Uncharacterized protein n=1 Tax=Trametes sanguinea TaxID=158606 RepID=A0ACC1N061_9APHY|nr:hypothetical protein NUW54_g12221 [Trametes sanguinea]
MKKDFATELEEQTYPEILRTNLANTVLELAKLGIDDLVHFDYLDAPAPETLMRVLGLLNYLAALDDDGKYMAKMLIVSPEFNCSHEILTIVAMLSVPSVWLRPQSQRREADSAKAMLIVPDSDHLTLMNLYKQYVSSTWSPAPQSECPRLTKTTSHVVDQHDKNWCWNNYLSACALQQAENVRTQLLRIMERNEIDLVTTDDERKLFQNICKALMCGFFIPEWVVFNEFVMTTKPYIRTVSKVKPEWLLEYAPDYNDLLTFPDGETKRALLRIQKKRASKAAGVLSSEQTAPDRTRQTMAGYGGFGGIRKLGAVQSGPATDPPHDANVSSSSRWMEKDIRRCVFAALLPPVVLFVMSGTVPS